MHSERPMLGFLTRPEMLAALGQPGENPRGMSQVAKQQ